MNKAMPVLAEAEPKATQLPEVEPQAYNTKTPRTRAVAEVALPSTLLNTTPQQAGTQSLLRGLAILEAAAAGVRDLRTFGAALGTTRSTTHRLVSSLVQARYLRQVQGGYLLGPKLIDLGTIALEQMPLTAVARQHLESLAEQTLDTIHLGVRDGDESCTSTGSPAPVASKCARASVTGCRSHRQGSAKP